MDSLGQKYTSSANNSTVDMKDQLLLNILKYLAVAIVTIIVVYIIINGPALWQRLVFSLMGNSNTVSADNIILQQYSSDTLVIPRIQLNAPIIWQIDESQLKQNLNQGLVHLKGSGLPNKTPANTLLVGYSSYYWWKSNPYYKVFSLLDRLHQGDTILLNYLNETYIYRIQDISVINPKSISEIFNSTNQTKSSLYLMTWTPIGTYWQALIVKAELIIEPSTN